MTNAQKFELLIDYCKCSLLLFFSEGEEYTGIESTNRYCFTFTLKVKNKSVSVSIQPLSDLNPDESHGVQIGIDDQERNTWFNASCWWGNQKASLDDALLRAARHLKS